MSWKELVGVLFWLLLFLVIVTKVTCREQGWKWDHWKSEERKELEIVYGRLYLHTHTIPKAVVIV